MPVVSAVPSAFAVRMPGLAVRPVIRLTAGGGGPGEGGGIGVGVGIGFGVGPGAGGGGSLPPSVPIAGRTSPPDEIVHAYGPLPAAVECHVQSISCELPDLVATTVPLESFTVTVHGRDDERRAWNRTLPPTTPLTTGAYSFGSPVPATRRAISGRSA